MAARTDAWRCALTLAGGLAGCGEVFDPASCPDRDCAFFDEEEWEALVERELVADPPADPTNRFEGREAAALLGQKLFFDKRYAGDPEHTSCASCHPTDTWFQTETSSRNTKDPWRNHPSLVNVAYYEWYSWDGARDSLWSQTLFPVEKPMKSDRLSIALLLLREYRTEYEAMFDPDEAVDGAELDLDQI